jgi:hypothetical protein
MKIEISFRMLLLRPGERANDLISLMTLCATSKDSVTAEGSSNPNPQVSVIIARWANLWGSPAEDAAFKPAKKDRRRIGGVTPGRVGTTS